MPQIRDDARAMQEAWFASLQYFATFAG